MTGKFDSSKWGVALLTPFLARIKSDLPWVLQEIDHAGTWGAVIYRLETRANVWRIVRIEADGSRGVSLSSDAANAEKTPLQAWAVRQELVYA